MTEHATSFTHTSQEFRGRRARREQLYQLVHNSFMGQMENLTLGVDVMENSIGRPSVVEKVTGFQMSGLVFNVLPNLKEGLCRCPSLLEQELLQQLLRKAQDHLSWCLGYPERETWI